MAPPLPPEHFALQLAFARRVAVVADISLDDALLRYTTSYTACGLRPGPDLAGIDAAAPEWAAFLNGFHAAPDPAAYIHGVYLASLKTRDPDRVMCFSCRYIEETRTVRIQFGNNDPAGSLKAARIANRVSELRDVCAVIASEFPDAERVTGRSWLYNLAAYRRLFPPAFVAQTEAVEGEYCVVSSWGPFLDRHGTVKAEMAAAFLAQAATATTLDDLLACFPFRVLATSCDITHFYTYYGVAAPLAAVSRG